MPLFCSFLIGWLLLWQESLLTEHPVSFVIPICNGLAWLIEWLNSVIGRQIDCSAWKTHGVSAWNINAIFMDTMRLHRTVSTVYSMWMEFPSRRNLQAFTKRGNFHPLQHIYKRRWYSGEHSCLPSSWPGFDSRPTHFWLWARKNTKKGERCCFEGPIVQFKWAVDTSHWKRHRFHGVMVGTLDSESSDPSSNLGGTSWILWLSETG